MAREDFKSDYKFHKCVWTAVLINGNKWFMFRKAKSKNEGMTININDFYFRV